VSVVTANPHLAEFLAPTHYVDCDSPAIGEFVSRVIGDKQDRSATEKAILLFDAVRDRIRYDPYAVSFAEADYRASAIVKKPSAFCVPKAIVLTAVLRAAGIPAAVGFADVRNHLNSAKLKEVMGTDLFIYHGYVALWLDGKMFKVTPAFNMELCERFGVRPLIFDGTADALFHEFDTSNHRHMEYVNDRGWFADAPIAKLLEDFRVTYPGLATLNPRGLSINDAAFGAPQSGE
jgi:transglutaminase-like putative cysteine protease